MHLIIKKKNLQEVIHRNTKYGAFHKTTGGLITGDPGARLAAAAEHRGYIVGHLGVGSGRTYSPSLAAVCHGAGVFRELRTTQ